MSAAEPIEVRDMRIIHRTFRTAFIEAAALVRAAPTPSSERVTFLADHIEFVLAILHAHHHGEDLLLYPLLMERVPGQAEEAARVEHEHVVIAGRIDVVSAAGAAWRAAPDVKRAEALAVSLDELNAALEQHLDDEEAEMVPLAAVTLTQEEWDALGHHSRGEIPPERMPIALGMICDPLDDDDRAFMLMHLPPPVTENYAQMIDAPWRAYAETLRHGA
jgi:hemerythrin-like domain-containing protein